MTAEWSRSTPASGRQFEAFAHTLAAMKRLLVFRHAKSDWNTGDPDHERPLNNRGRQSASAIGMALARSREVPELAVTSSARRARSTLEIAVETGGWDTEILVDSELYGTSPAGALAVVSSAPPDVHRLMIVGHQPTWGGLVEALTGGSVLIKTATVVAIDLAIGSWREAPRARGSVSYMIQSRLFTEGSWNLSPL
jgi:phosphohistidine phosphatase